MTDTATNMIANALCGCLQELGLYAYLTDGGAIRVIRHPQRVGDYFKSGVIILIEGEQARVGSRDGSHRLFHLGDPYSIDDIYYYCIERLQDLEYAAVLAAV